MHWLSFGGILHKILWSTAKENKTEKIVMGPFVLQKTSGLFPLLGKSISYCGKFEVESGALGDGRRNLSRKG